MLGCIQPMSSPMMKRMLGFLSAACAVTAISAAHSVAAHCRGRLYLMFPFLVLLVCIFVRQPGWRAALKFSFIKTLKLTGRRYEAAAFQRRSQRRNQIGC